MTMAGMTPRVNPQDAFSTSRCALLLNDLGGLIADVGRPVCKPIAWMAKRLGWGRHSVGRCLRELEAAGAVVVLRGWNGVVERVGLTLAGWRLLSREFGRVLPEPRLIEDDAPLFSSAPVERSAPRTTKHPHGDIEQCKRAEIAAPALKANRDSLSFTGVVGLSELMRHPNATPERVAWVARVCRRARNPAGWARAAIQGGWCPGNAGWWRSDGSSPIERGAEVAAASRPEPRVTRNAMLTSMRQRLREVCGAVLD